MTESKIQKGNFVWYAAKGIGQVLEDGSKTAVLFWAERKSGRTENIPPSLLTPLTTYFPEAEHRNHPDPWKQCQASIRKAPLTMAALALEACGGAGNEAALREKLDKRTPLGPWNTWWRSTEQKLGRLPQHFRVEGAGPETRYSLRTTPASVPQDWKPTLADWKDWLTAETGEPPPQPSPPHELADAIAECPEDTVQQALSQLTRGAKLWLDSPSKPAAAAMEWMDAITSATMRSTSGAPTADRVEILFKLSQFMDRKSEEWLLFQAGMTAARTGQWAQHQMDQLRQSHAAELQQERAEQERLRQELEALRATET